MHGVVCAAVVGLMAIGVRATARSSQCVTASGCAVALRALHRGVQAGQRESGVVVVERGVGPGDRVMARVAGLREAGSDVVRNVATQSLRAGPVRGVAGVASRVGGGKGVIVADVALVAIRDHARRSHLVVPRQGPTR